MNYWSYYQIHSVTNFYKNVCKPTAITQLIKIQPIKIYLRKLSMLLYERVKCMYCVHTDTKRLHACFYSISEQQDVISDMQRRFERDRNILEEENKKLQIETEKVPRATR